jgi:hypothetical protein
MDANKRGNPPFEPSSYAAGLERRLKRHERWASRAVAATKWLLDGTDHEKEFAEKWWRDYLNQPTIALSEDPFTPPNKDVEQ